jgi:phosphoglycolate phosphatase-like HAD superfamily hydrolase
VTQPQSYGRPVAIAFDLDGTLLHFPLDWGSVRRRLGELFSPLGYRGLFDPVLEKIDEAAKQVAKSEDQRMVLTQRARSIIDEEEQRAAMQAKPVATVRPTVQGLNRRGYPLGIVTNCGRAALRNVLVAAGLNDIPWRVANTRDDVSHPKPNPEGVIGAARALTPYGGILWYVGASVADIRAGQEANRLLAGVDIRTVVVINNRHGRAAELRGARPDHAVDRLEGLLTLVFGNW